MKRDFEKKLFSIIFLGVFFLKMLLTIAPLIAAQFDKQQINAVIMQLEIESNAKSNDVKESSAKEYFTLNCFKFSLLHPTRFMLPEMISVDHGKHVRAFYPSVPTPPPNS
jgi:hypothetical protein